MRIIPPRRREKEWWEDDEQRRAAVEVAGKLGLSRRDLIKFMAATSSAAGAALLLDACGGGEEKKPAGEATGAAGSPAAGGLPGDAAPADKQVFRTYVTTDPGTLEYNGSYYGGGISQLFAPLQAYDVNFNVENYLAVSVEKSADGTTWTYKLNPNAKWSNGQAMTAEDWVFSFKYTVEPKRTTNSALTLYYEIEGAEDYNKGKGSFDAIGVKAIDPQTVQIKLRRPFGVWPLINAYWSSTPVYRPAVEKYGEKWTAEDTIVTNGPFKLTSWKHNEKLVAEPFEGWVGKKPNLRRLEYLIVDANAALLAYENDELDYNSILPADWPRIQADANLKKQVELQAGINTWYLLGEVNHKPFDDKRVRLAVHHAIDRDKIAKQVLQGLAAPAFSFVAPEIKIGNVSDDAEVKDLQKYDPQAALAALRGSPYEGGTNWPSKITLAWPNTRDASVNPAAEAIAIMLRDVLKMPVELLGIENRTFVAQAFQNPKPFPMVFWAWTADYPHPENYFLPVFASIPPPDKRRHMFSDARFDELTQKAGGIIDEAEADRTYKELGKILIREGYATMIIHKKNAFLFKPRVGGLPRNKSGEWPQANMYRRTFEEIYIKKS
jgi:oligopeptide transport system substrate-binding protein